MYAYSVGTEIDKDTTHRGGLLYWCSLWTSLQEAISYYTTNFKSIKYEVNFRIRSGIYIDVNYGQYHYVWWNSSTNINQFEQVCKQS